MWKVKPKLDVAAQLYSVTLKMYAASLPSLKVGRCAASYKTLRVTLCTSYSYRTRTGNSTRKRCRSSRCP